jgi:hypothetical protein
MPTVPNWKRAESRLADFFGTCRRPLSGGNSKSGGRDDAQHKTLYLESKYSKHQMLWRLFEDTRAKAKREKKTPVIGLMQQNAKGAILCIHTDDLAKVFCEYARVNLSARDYRLMLAAITDLLPEGAVAVKKL